MIIAGREFGQVLLADFEYYQPEGELPEPLCVVIKNIVTGEVHRIWLQGGGQSPPPALSQPDTLLVAYQASAEVLCLLMLRWPKTEWVLDIYPEYLNITNGKRPPGKTGLATAVNYFGGNEIDVINKTAMRELAQRRGGYTEEERRRLLDYCESDVIALEQVLQGVMPHLDRDFSFMRGRFMRAVAEVEHAGIPIDVEAHGILKGLWSDLRRELTREIGDQFPGVFRDGSLNLKGFDSYLRVNGISWPRTKSGRPKVDQDTFKEWAPLFPQLKPLKELLAVISQLKLNRLAIGNDGRNRFYTNPFRSRTSRNQPSANRNIFGLPSFMRGLVKPPPGYGLAYLDYEQQEFGIAAALSGDRAMQAAYSTGDPYLSFAKQAGAAPPDATKISHREIREAFKQTALGVQYGMGAQTLAFRLGGSEAKAKELLALHRRTYRQFWRWTDTVTDRALQERNISTRFGWRLHITKETKPRTLLNFPMQANGADMLRLAVCLAQDAGIKIVAMIHDAILIEAPEGELEQAVIVASKAMARASEVILMGFRLRSESWVIRYPERMLPPNGVDMWRKLWQVAARINGRIPEGILPK